MLSAKETAATIDAMIAENPLRDGTEEERNARYREYREAYTGVESNFREYLEKVYAPTFSGAVHDKLWQKAQDTANTHDGAGSATSYYSAIECVYRELVEFVESVKSLL